MVAIFGNKTSAIEYAKERAKTQKGHIPTDRHVVDLGMRDPTKKGQYAVIIGTDTRTIFTAKGVRVAN